MQRTGTPDGFSRPLSGGRRGNFKYFWLEFNSFDFVERDLVLGPIIEFRGTRRLMRGDFGMLVVVYLIWACKA